MQTRNRLIAVAALTALVVLVGACKSTDTEPGSVTTMAPPAGTSETPATATPSGTTLGTFVPGTVPGAVRGVLRRANGDAVSGATIKATSLDKPAKPIPEVAVVTNDYGRFVWPLLPGKYRIEVTIVDFGTAAADVIVGDNTPEVDLVLP